MASKVPPPQVARAVERARHHLSRLRQRSAPPAAVMMELILNAWVAQAITTAADLGVADALAGGPLSGEQLAERVGADADALRRLMRALIGIGIFRQHGDGRYALTRSRQPCAPTHPCQWPGWRGGSGRLSIASTGATSPTRSGTGIRWSQHSAANRYSNTWPTKRNWVGFSTPP